MPVARLPRMKLLVGHARFSSLIWLVLLAQFFLHSASQPASRLDPEPVRHIGGLAIAKPPFGALLPLKSGWNWDSKLERRNVSINHGNSTAFSPTVSSLKPCVLCYKNSPTRC
ncbi:hypothetical protein FH972_024718 [Carpinus fangiana]|uniref:Uncharacterized protein n=1 Tax=Carpinus fangiana TaxID=176857 RepID=A0A5N6KYT5_9ROSI|nr:hypothetical protein FH972_024718 [Carpinus fangiana]